MPLTGGGDPGEPRRFGCTLERLRGSERSEAQTFLNDLFACYGVERRDVARFEEPQAGRFLDPIWPRVCIIEMKAPREAARLAQHREQALRYWIESADPAKNTPAPKYVVLCAFKKLEVWEPGAYPGGPRLELDLIDLPDQYDALLFLAGGARFYWRSSGSHARCRQSRRRPLQQPLDRTGGAPDVLRDFMLQCVWCMFADDLGQIPEHRFSQLIDDLIANPQRSSADELGNSSNG